MTTAPTPAALAIADLLEYLDDGGLQFDGQPLPDAAAAELIRLQAEIECLRKELDARKPLPLSDEQIGRLREQAFSTNNPFCPCDSKTMRKAVRAAERAHGITGRSS